MPQLIVPSSVYFHTVCHRIEQMEKNSVFLTEQSHHERHARATASYLKRKLIQIVLEEKEDILKTKPKVKA